MVPCDILIQELRSGLLLSELENGPNFVLIWHLLVFKARCLPEQFHFKLWCKIAFVVGSPLPYITLLALKVVQFLHELVQIYFSWPNISNHLCCFFWEKETQVLVLQNWRLPQFFRNGASFFICLLVFPYKATALSLFCTLQIKVLTDYRGVYSFFYQLIWFKKKTVQHLSFSAS